MTRDIYEASAIIVKRERAGGQPLWYEIMDGPYAGIRFAVPSGERPYAHVGSVTRVRFCPDDQYATAVVRS